MATRSEKLALYGVLTLMADAASPEVPRSTQEAIRLLAEELGLPVPDGQPRRFVLEHFTFEVGIEMARSS